MSSPHENADSQQPLSTYEQCRDELEHIVQLLEQGGQDLDTSMKLWERAEQLAQQASDYLTQAHTKITSVLEETCCEEVSDDDNDLS